MAELQLGGKTIATQTGNEEAIMHSSLLRVAARSQPNTPVKGDIYLDSTDNKLKIHNGTAFINMVSEPASGGIVTTYTLSGVTYQVHTFLQSQSFILLIDKTVDILLVAGGGGGGRYSANGVGGGGAGGMVVGNNISRSESMIVSSFVDSLIRSSLNSLLNSEFLSSLTASLNIF